MGCRVSWPTLPYPTLDAILCSIMIRIRGMSEAVPLFAHCLPCASGAVWL